MHSGYCRPLSRACSVLGLVAYLLCYHVLCRDCPMSCVPCPVSRVLVSCHIPMSYSSIISALLPRPVQGLSYVLCSVFLYLIKPRECWALWVQMPLGWGIYGHECVYKCEVCLSVGCYCVWL